MERQYNDHPDSVTRLKRCFDWDSSGKVLIYSVVVGFLTGLAAVCVYFTFQHIDQCAQGFYTAAGIELPTPEDYTARTGVLPGEVFKDAERKDILFGELTLPRYWILMILIPSFGGLLCGFLVWSFAPEASGEGTDSVIRTFHFRNGVLRNRLPIVKTLAGFLTIGSGGSAGWEGPMTLFGAGIAGTLSQYMRLNVKDRRTLLLAGAAGGLGAILQIPFGGALFAAEILYASTALEFAAIVPCAIASIVGYSTFRFFYGDIRALDISSSIGIHHLTDVPVFVLFILITALCGFLFVRLVLELRNRVFRRLWIPEFLKPALGGFLLGCVALTCPHVFGGGYAWTNRLLENQLPFLLLLILIVPKMLATAFTISSGGSGGMLAPSLFIGGLIGGSLGHLATFFFDCLGMAGMAPDITTCILIGMSTFYAGIGKIPFAAAVIVCEMAGFDYSLLVPLIVLNLIHIAIQSPSTSLYEEQVLAPIDSEAHFGTYSVDLLRAIKVSEVRCFDQGHPSVTTIPSGASIPETARKIASRPDSLFPVINSQGRIIGVLLASDVWSVFRTRKKWGTLTAGELVQEANISVTPQDNLYKALRLCTIWQVSELPVVAPDEPDRLLGMLRHYEIITAYNQRLAVSQWD